MSYSTYTNANAVTQSKGAIVRAGAAAGQCLLAQANVPANYAGLLGARYSDVAAGSSGFVGGFQDGAWVRMVSAVPAGSPVYLSDASPGLGTGTSPAIPVLLGYAYQTISEAGVCYAVLKTSLAITGLVTNYGADPTGVQDSQPAIAACLAANGYAVFPPGTYLTLSEVVLSVNGQQLIGYGGAAVKKGGDFNAVRITANYCKVAGLEIDGNAKQYSCILVLGFINQVVGCYLHNTAGSGATVGHGVCLDGQATTCVKNLVSGNNISTIAGVGIAQNKATDSRLVDNQVTSTGLEGITIDNASYRCSVVGNKLSTTCVTGGAAAISTDNGGLDTISSNIIAGCAMPGIKTNNNLGPTNYETIVGNVIVDPTTYGIHLFAGTGGTASNCMIGSNLVRGTLTAWCRFDAGCNNNVAQYNQKSGLPTSDAGAGNTY